MSFYSASGAASEVKPDFLSATSMRLSASAMSLSRVLDAQRFASLIVAGTHVDDDFIKKSGFWYCPGPAIRTVALARSQEVRTELRGKSPS